jgi:hypothetical protein
MRGLIAARTAVATAVAAIDADMRRMTRASADRCRLMTIPGVGQLTALGFRANALNSRGIVGAGNPGAEGIRTSDLRGAGADAALTAPPLPSWRALVPKALAGSSLDRRCFTRPTRP